MSISYLLEILSSHTKIVSDKSAANIYLNIISQTGHQIVPDYICITLIKIYNNKKFVNVLFFITCCFRIVFPCGNVICRIRYSRDFKLNHYQQFKAYYTKFTHCKKLIKKCDAFTDTQEIGVHPNCILCSLYQNDSI